MLPLFPLLLLLLLLFEQQPMIRIRLMHWTVTLLRCTAIALTTLAATRSITLAHSTSLQFTVGRLEWLI
jgi:hypothetical protein